MPELSVCIVGGIFDRSEEYRRRHRYTPETVLAQGLAERGVHVTTSGHRHFVPSDRHQVVHVHHLGRGALWMATARTSSRFVYTAHHAAELLDPTQAHRVPLLRTRIMATRLIAGRADALVALSELERSALRAHLGDNFTKVRVIPNGIPAEVFHLPGRPRRLAPCAPARLLFVGQLVHFKGVDLLLQALARLRATEDAELLLAYQNPALEETYRKLAGDLGLSDRVRFLGMLSAAELGTLYREVDLLVLPSRSSEALPSVITEAMMSGLPIVSTAVAGIPEQVGPHGRIVPPGDLDRLTDAIRATLADIRAGRYDPAAISADANRRFAIPAMVDAHLRLYERLAAQTTPPARHLARYRPTNAVARLALRTCGDRLTGRGLLAK